MFPVLGKLNLLNSEGAEGSPTDYVFELFRHNLLPEVFYV